MKRWVSIMNLCTAWNISVFRSHENDLFPCNNKSILMSILLLFGIINVCMESNKINLKLLNLGQISKKWLLSSNEPLQFGQLILSDKKSLNKCAFRLSNVASICGLSIIKYSLRLFLNFIATVIYISNTVHNQSIFFCI